MIKRPFQESGLANSASDILANGIQSVVLDPAPECVAKLLSLAVDHIDTLLEDWWVAAAVVREFLFLPEGFWGDNEEEGIKIFNFYFNFLRIKETAQQ